MILVTGASGALGGLVAEELAALGLAAGRDYLLGSRKPAEDALGRRVDFDDPAGLVDAFAGVDTLLLISAGAAEDDVVMARHGAAIDAAAEAGVGHVVYTSVSGDGDHLTYALAHRWTERRLRGSGLTWTILRNGLYAEFLASIAAPAPDGTVVAPLGDGRLAAVARRDLAEAAARVAADPAPHAGRVHELVGTAPLGGAELAAALGTDYRPAGLEATRAAVAGSGTMLPFQVPMLLSTYSAIAGGFLDGGGVDGNALPELLPHPPRSALEVYREAVGTVKW
ncbi:NmrA family transcriptional regulator [Mangrovactinospora gilvigrisea]|uniref:NmrA family transcriptional regulator n=1 Tax=Mangrovactinospora gilvigrisea TaxID=1428644 RepID=A0A1J7C6F6_9ACTN|nr:NAD(P)H-binding protein [Mangrovactinospora gilvigrisea]OIV37124.1 NmrA family transcriptional regulator [Mangrovactinospora gilvigrisea]